MSEEILSEKLLGKGWGTLKEYNFRHRRLDGEVNVLKRELYHYGDAAAIILYDPRNEQVLLVRQFRPAPMVNGDDPYTIEVVSGLIENEAPERTARREAFEEAGINYITNLKLWITAYPLCATVGERLAMYIGFYESGQTAASGGVHSEGEDIEIIEVPLDAAYHMIETGEIVDLKTIALIQALMLKKLRKAEF